jgi:hypothetical protein
MVMRRGTARVGGKAVLLHAVRNKYATAGPVVWDAAATGHKASV